MSRPRVTAHRTIDAISEETMCSPARYATPSVEVSVCFDLHDHEAALTALETAVADVRAQIEETR